MKIIVIGMGEVGSHIASVLAQAKHDVTVIDENAHQLSRAGESMDVMALRGNGASLKVLRQARAADADLSIAVTNRDEVNILAALTAKRLGTKRAVARVVTHHYLDSDEHGSYQDILGIDLVINQQALTAAEIHRLVKTFSAIAVELFVDNLVQMIELPIPDGLGIIGKPIRDLSLPDSCLVAGIIRDGALLLPGKLDTIQEGDQVFLIGAVESIPGLERMFGMTGARRARKVIIIGGGEVGISVARLLAKDQIDVVLIESDPGRCVELSNELSSSVVIHGDGTDPNLLREEKAGDCDVFVAVSGDDDTNLMSSLLAKHSGAGKTISLVSRGDYVPICEALGLDATVSPRLAAANRILKFARTGEVVSVTVLEEGKAEIIEIVPVEGSSIVNRPLREVNFPRGAVLAVVSGEKGPYVPRGRDVIRPGETTVVFTSPQARPSVERLFRKRLLSLS